MSARSAAEAMRAAAEQVHTAKTAVTQHRGRGNRGLRAHVTDAHELTQMTSQAIRVLVHLSDVMQTVATSARQDYLTHTAPDGSEWPETVMETARDFALATNAIRNQLAKLGAIHRAYNAAALLHAALQNAHRDANRKAS